MRIHKACSLTFVLGACTSTIAEDATRAAMFRGGSDHTGVYPATVGRELAGPGVALRHRWRGDRITGAHRRYALDRQRRRGESARFARAPAKRCGASISAARSRRPAAVSAGVLIAGTRDGAFHALLFLDRAHPLDGDIRRRRGVALGTRERRSLLPPRPRSRVELPYWRRATARCARCRSTQGRDRWRVSLHTRIRSSPAVSSGTVFLGGRGRKGVRARPGHGRHPAGPTRPSVRRSPRGTSATTAAPS
jgi:hypothetical protein